MANGPRPAEGRPPDALWGRKNLRMRPEKVKGMIFRTRVRIPPSPPQRDNPNLYPIGHGFGFLVYIEEIADW